MSHTSKSKEPRVSVSIDNLESQSSENDIQTEHKHELKKHLKKRHVSCIALGGSIGVGLFVGSGGSLAKAGPVGMLLGYIFMGTLAISTLSCLCEMCAYLGSQGNIVEITTRYIDDSMGFAFTWSYALSYSLTFPSEISSICLLIGYWDTEKKLPDWAIVLIFTFLITLVNAIDVGVYGEIEYWIVLLKFITLIGCMIFNIITTCGANPLHKRTGFQYWKNPGPFNNYLTNRPLGKFLGFWAVNVNAGFGYQGTEVVALTSSEVEDFRKMVPSIMKTVIVRILFFNIVSLFTVSLMVSSKDKNLLDAISSGDASGAQSPFVIAISNAGVRALPSVVNGVILLAAISAANTQIYIPSRTFFFGEKKRFVPKWLSKTNKRGVPLWSVIFNGSFGLLALLTLNSTSSQVFTWLMNLTTVFGFLSWAVINYAFLRFYFGLKKQKINRKENHTYRSPLQPYSSIYALFVLIMITITQGFPSFVPWNYQDFLAAYISLIIFVVLWFGYKIYAMKFFEPKLSDINLTSENSFKEYN
ncbi:Piso0_004729 [Millerozyma farinosa CBS 7064]|uniref:Piso0_004729 protein n=1 Tax=Pichia sorbitophila (strain ATCC MYA-4447 / BCRC 22081 / CBS 7064 / NBRC 10061 / NRRL Y-12695) TaxID=559304 RepID=G8Y696_PICSO|nr:Piso0_004729 [Millerozyma farinosa CBS 7064]CCE85157.1 Piso0_004729 [Millerozyma farinosa CBS 7064]